MPPCEDIMKDKDIKVLLNTFIKLVHDMEHTGLLHENSHHEEAVLFVSNIYMTCGPES